MEKGSGEKQKYSSKQHSCKTCEKSFRDKSALTIHESVHTGEKPYRCKICEKTFARNSDLSKHKKIHTGVKPINAIFVKRLLLKIVI